jgi:WD40 repeat protein
MVKVWNLNTYNESCTLEGHVSSVKSVAFNPDNKTIASTDGSDQIKLWNIISCKEINIIGSLGNRVIR